MLWLLHTQSCANPTLTPTDTQVISWEQPLQPYLPPGSLMPADTQITSCRSPAARGSSSLRSWRLCTERRLVLYHLQSQPLPPGESVTQFPGTPGKYWGPQGYRTGSPSLYTMGHSQAGSSCHRRLCGDKMPAGQHCTPNTPGQSPSRHPSLCCATSLAQSRCQSSPAEMQGTLQLSPFLGERPLPTGCIH